MIEYRKKCPALIYECRTYNLFYRTRSDVRQLFRSLFCLLRFYYKTFAQDHKCKSRNLIPLNLRLWIDLQPNGYFSIKRIFKNPPETFQQFVLVIDVSQWIDNKT